MSIVQSKVITAERRQSAGQSPSSAADGSIVDRVLRLLSSVRFGVVMLVLLLICCMIGMLIMQQNVQGFREYYENLSPSQRALYTSLGVFDIYHSWYFTLLLAVTGLNIVLSSIDRFPTAWKYIRCPKVAASPKFIAAQVFNTVSKTKLAQEAAARNIVESWRRTGVRPRSTREGDRITVFGQRNVWNRLGAYVVHAALLTILIGGFLTSRYGQGGSIEIAPNETANSFVSAEAGLDGERVAQIPLPFSIKCTDLQQELIRPEGGLDVMNTIDWRSYITIQDAGQETPALVHLNSPFDYRGYRFFQSSFQALGSARNVTVRIEPLSGGVAREAIIPRDGSIDVDAIGRVEYVNFYPDLSIEDGKPATASAEYNNPAAELRITSPEGGSFTMLALAPKSRREHTGADEDQTRLTEVSGVKASLINFEKVARSHTLTVQYDPGRLPVYVGFLLLVASLSSVFFFSHQRVWAVIEAEGRGSKVYFGGNTNRNRTAFEGCFNSMVRAATQTKPGVAS